MNAADDSDVDNDNVDPEEIAKFAAAAARWWDPESEFKPLHQINPLRVDWIDARAPLAGKSVLDVGCGGGILAEAMAQRGAAVTGIDIGAAALDVARLHALETGAAVQYRCITAEALAAEIDGAETADADARWDVVCCLELLEHVPDPARVVAACAALVKPGGAVFFSTINRNLKSFLLAIVGAEYILGMLPRGTHQYERLIRPSELNRWCARSGLSLREITGLHYNPLSQTYALGGDAAVNYIMHCTKPR